MDNELLQCQICCFNYDSNQHENLPKLLPCGHTLCAGCIDKLILNNSSKATLKCPMCKNILPTLSSSSQLKNNFAIISLLESLASRKEKPFSNFYSNKTPIVSVFP